MPSRYKTFRCVCIICCDNNTDGQDILISERSAHLLRAKREGLRSLMGTSIPLGTPPKEFSSSSLPLPTLPGDCYVDSSVPSSQSIPFPSRFATRTEKREKNHLTKKAHATFDVVERRANEILSQLPTIDNSFGIQAVEEDIAVICSALESVKRRITTIDIRREKISRLFTQIDACLLA